jgi:hypothetical protein
VQLIPQVSREGHQVGTEWGRKVSQEIMIEMRREFPELMENP